MGGTLDLFFSTRGVIAPRAFVRALLVLYPVALASWVVLSSPVHARVGILPFAFLHLILVWCWLALHRRRARDAGRSTRAPSVVAAIYALAIVCVLVFVWQIFSVRDADTADLRMRTDPLMQLYIVPLGVIWFRLVWHMDFDLMALGIRFVALMLAVPFVLPLGYSIWLARRPTAVGHGS